MNKLLIVDNPKKHHFSVDGVQVVSAKEYLTNPAFGTKKNLRVFNLCNDYGYQSKGYYVSLLAEARDHRPTPSVKSILDLKSPSLIRVASDELDSLIQRSLAGLKSNEFTLSIYFGQNVAKKYRELSRAFHRHYQVPYLRVKFQYNQKWQVQSLRTIPSKEIPEDHFPLIEEFAQAYFHKKRYDKAKPSTANYSLGIMVKEGDEAPASNPKALQKFVESAEKAGFATEFITGKDFNRLPAFDALFIRQSTHVNNETYRFARKAQAEGIALVDYPEAILKCSNKVYMAELLELAGVAQPKTVIVHRRNRKQVESLIGLPCVLKSPDSTFSFGVKKAETPEELDQITSTMLKKSELIIAQEFCFTDYDWRIGVLDGQAIYACKYFMARDHWQIYNWSADDKVDTEGEFETLPLNEVPSSIINIAVKSAKLLGDGLYGVDVKLIDNQPVVIEVNDNPNIDFGIEDKVLGNQLYELIINAFKERIEKRLKGIIQ